MTQVETGISPLDELGERLRKAGDAVAATKQRYDDALAIRDEIVVEAHDVAGLNYAQIAKLAQIAPSRVVQIIAKAG